MFLVVLIPSKVWVSLPEAEKGRSTILGPWTRNLKFILSWTLLPHPFLLEIKLSLGAVKKEELRKSCPIWKSGLGWGKPDFLMGIFTWPSAIGSVPRVQTAFKQSPRVPNRLCPQLWAWFGALNLALLFPKAKWLLSINTRPTKDFPKYGPKRACAIWRPQWSLNS